MTLQNVAGQKRIELSRRRDAWPGHPASYRRLRRLRQRLHQRELGDGGGGRPVHCSRHGKDVAGASLKILNHVIDVIINVALLTMS